MAIPVQKPALPAIYLAMLQSRPAAPPRADQAPPNPNLRERPIAPDRAASGQNPGRGRLVNILV